MYTQCPKCGIAFRVTADVLKVAVGHVRCGGCAKAFNALDYLSEAMPVPEREEAEIPELQPEASGGDASLPASISAEQSAALLKTLDELAGSDIRIEDTGVEWRVLDDEDEPESDNDTETHLDDDEIDGLRFDDNTPLPDGFGGDLELHDAEDTDEETDEDDIEIVTDEDVAVADDSSSDISLSDPHEWTDILDEFEDQGPEFAGDDESSIEVEVLDDTAVEELDDEDILAPAADESSSWVLLDDDDDNDAAPDSVATGGLTLEEELAAVEDQEQTSAQAAIDLLGMESIILEGETVRTALDDEQAEANAEAAAEIMRMVEKAEAENAEPDHRQRNRMAAGLVALVLLLLVQVVHQSREALATIGPFNATVGSIYRAVGSPLFPEWDVSGWRFEVTRASAETAVNGGDRGVAEKLTLYTRIGNESDRALPYPLIVISLTDRFQEPIGSRVVEPASYLTTATDPDALVPAGSTFDAVVAIRSPSADATGYELRACYRESASSLRCKDDNFK